MLADNITEMIGNTPLVRLNKIPQSEGIECEVYAKCEFLNPGGSVKDRIGKRMVDEAKQSGLLKEGDTIIEPTSGNTGIGLALSAAVNGYNCTIVMPEKMSKEKEFLLRGLGADIVRTPTSAAFDADNSHLCIAAQLEKEIGSSAHILNQYINPYNPIAHFDQTGEEILEACRQPDGTVKLDLVVAGLGTGGTFTGLFRKISAKHPTCKFTAVDPIGSMLATGNVKDVSSYEVEGVGYDFYPTVLDRPQKELYERVGDKESMLMARRLMREEGLLCGGSSGLNLVGAFRAIRKLGLGKGHRVVVIMPDSIRNYLTKHLSDAWMYSRKFIDLPKGDDFTKSWQSHSLDSVKMTLKPTVLLPGSTSIRDAVNRLNQAHQTLALIVDDSVNGGGDATKAADCILGVFDSDAYFPLLQGSVKPSDPVSKVINRNIKTIQSDSDLETAGRLLAEQAYIVINDLKGHWLLSKSDMFYWTMLHE